MNVRNLKKKTGSFLAPLGLKRRKMEERPAAFILGMPDRFINTKSPDFRHAAADDICKAVRKYAEERGREIEITHDTVPVEFRLDGKRYYIRLRYEGIFYRYECVKGRK